MKFVVKLMSSGFENHQFYKNKSTTQIDCVVVKIYLQQLKIVAMPVNKNALIRYKTIDNCLRNPYRRWTLDDLVDACCDALYEYEEVHIYYRPRF